MQYFLILKVIIYTNIYDLFSRKILFDAYNIKIIKKVAFIEYWILNIEYWILNIEYWISNIYL